MQFKSADPSTAVKNDDAKLVFYDIEAVSYTHLDVYKRQVLIIDMDWVPDAGWDSE